MATLDRDAQVTEADLLPWSQGEAGVCRIRGVAAHKVGDRPLATGTEARVRVGLRGLEEHGAFGKAVMLVHESPRALVRRGPVSAQLADLDDAVAPGLLGLGDLLCGHRLGARQLLRPQQDARVGKRGVVEVHPHGAVAVLNVARCELCLPLLAALLCVEDVAHGERLASLEDDARVLEAHGGPRLSGKAPVLAELPAVPAEVRDGTLPLHAERVLLALGGLEHRGADRVRVSSVHELGSRPQLGAHVHETARVLALCLHDARRVQPPARQQRHAPAAVPLTLAIVREGHVEQVDPQVLTPVAEEAKRVLRLALLVIAVREDVLAHSEGPLGRLHQAEVLEAELLPQAQREAPVLLVVAVAAHKVRDRALARQPELTP
mmetsp:Transcript_84870/g.218632  ORF Transcript_84870/g.218632 Transcript_84870/m.218632 type:complete len:378 (+) Transcript_84870:768-1901(+)